MNGEGQELRYMTSERLGYTTKSVEELEVYLKAFVENRSYCLLSANCQTVSKQFLSFAITHNPMKPISDVVTQSFDPAVRDDYARARSEAHVKMTEHVANVTRTIELANASMNHRQDPIERYTSQRAQYDAIPHGTPIGFVNQRGEISRFF